jgi:hypothetical protein
LKYGIHSTSQLIYSFLVIIGESTSTSSTEESGRLVISTGDSDNAGGIQLMAGVSHMGDLRDFEGAAINIKVCLHIYHQIVVFLFAVFPLSQSSKYPLSLLKGWRE